jgi:3-oxoacyl-[acyl-carrier protein] reductase
MGSPSLGGTWNIRYNHRVPTPKEVAKAILFLASPSAQWASGAILDFNGASYLRM